MKFTFNGFTRDGMIVFDELGPTLAASTDEIIVAEAVKLGVLLPDATCDPGSGNYPIRLMVSEKPFEGSQGFIKRVEGSNVDFILEGADELLYMCEKGLLEYLGFVPDVLYYQISSPTVE